MEELYKRSDKYSMLEDNILATSQTVMITAQSSKLATKGQSKQKGGGGGGGVQSKNQKFPSGPVGEKEGTPAVYPSEHLIR